MSGHTHTHIHTHTYTHNNYYNPRCAHAHRGLITCKIANSSFCTHTVQWLFCHILKTDSRNNHFYSTLFKAQERESEQRKESQNTHANKKTLP